MRVGRRSLSCRVRGATAAATAVQQKSSCVSDVPEGTYQCSNHSFSVGATTVSHSSDSCWPLSLATTLPTFWALHEPATEPLATASATRPQKCRSYRWLQAYYVTKYTRIGTTAALSLTLRRSVQNTLNSWHPSFATTLLTSKHHSSWRPAAVQAAREAPLYKPEYHTALLIVQGIAHVNHVLP